MAIVNINTTIKDVVVKYPEIQKFPKLLMVVDEYIKSNGVPQPGFLTNLTVYVRRNLDAKGINIPEAFMFSEEDIEEFGSWGYNSRWGNVFEPLLLGNFEEYLGVILEKIQEVRETDLMFGQKFKEEWD